MSTPANGLQQSFTPQEVDAWLLAAQERRAALHLKAAAPWNSNERHEAFTAMSDLLLQAFEEVRVISTAWQETSQRVREQSHDLQAHATRLMERGATLMERMAQFASPPPQDVQQAESRTLEMFKADHRHEGG
jgi:hypothetical protein